MRHAQFAVILLPALVVSAAVVMPSPASVFGVTVVTAAQDASAIEAALGLDRPTRRLIQQGLRNEGFDPGPPDGLFGPHTRAAIRAWQAARDEPQTGYLDGGDQVAVLLAAAVPRPVATSPEPPDPAPASAPAAHAPAPVSAPDAELTAAATDAQSSATPNAAAAPLAVESSGAPAQASRPGELPPEILIDRRLVRVDRLLARDDHRAAHDVMNEVLALQREHGVALPAEFPFKYAQVAMAAGLPETAVESLNDYLLAVARDGEFYRDALELLESPEEAVRRADAERRRAEAERRRAEAERRRAAAVQRENDELRRRQAEVAAVPLAPDALRSGGLAPVMVTVAAGRFQYHTRQPVPGRRSTRDHLEWVTFDRSFAIGKYEVTRGDFDRFVDRTRYRTDARRDPEYGCYAATTRFRRRDSGLRWNRPGFDQTNNHPVTCVSIGDALAYTGDGLVGAQQGARLCWGRGEPMRGAAAALVVVVAAVTSADDAAAQVLNRTSQPATGWTDHPIRPGVTSIKAAHFDELRARVAALRAREGLALVRWTDPVLTPGATTIRQAHLAELRDALGGVFDAREQLQPAYTDRTLTTRRTLVRAAHVMELREAVEVLESPAPSLEPYYTQLPLDVVIDPNYRPHGHDSASTDLDGDGNEDLVVLGYTYRGTAANHRPQPGRVFLGDGDGGFGRAPAELFPVDTLNTVNPSCCPQFGDLNGDGLPDMFLPMGGWDRDPFPGEQNRLYLSRPGGGWRDATSVLPQLSDFTHSAAIGDIRGLGTPDIVVGNIGDDDRILPYVLLNGGDDSFLLDRTILPAYGETMNFYTNGGHAITGTVLTDLDGDGLPELIAVGEGPRRHGGPGSFVFWNRAGAFSEEDKTPLPTPAPFGHSYIALASAALDADGDGLLDLVIVGTQRKDPFYDGWFVQLLMNQGDRTFVDETALRLQPHEQSSGNAGVATGAPWAERVEIVDFNGDGAADFVMSPTPSAGIAAEYLRPNQPLIWLNDGSGRFSALKVHDFVRPGYDWLLLGARLVRTRHGYSYISTRQFHPDSGGFILTGLLATRPYH